MLASMSLLVKNRKVVERHFVWLGEDIVPGPYESVFTPASSRNGIVFQTPSRQSLG
jgi:hypothetical protein